MLVRAALRATPIRAILPRWAGTPGSRALYTSEATATASETGQEEFNGSPEICNLVAKVRAPVMDLWEKLGEPKVGGDFKHPSTIKWKVDQHLEVSYLEGTKADTQWGIWSCGKDRPPEADVHMVRQKLPGINVEPVMPIKDRKPFTTPTTREFG